MKKQKVLKALTLNKELVIDNALKEEITTAECGRYSYFDYDKKIIEKIAQKRKDVLTKIDIFHLVQALFPQYLVCGGLFDNYLLFKIKNQVRVDPPLYYYNHICSYLNNNNDAKCNRLIDEIVDLFHQNNIKYHPDWDLLKNEVKE